MKNQNEILVVSQIETIKLVVSINGVNMLYLIQTKGFNITLPGLVANVSLSTVYDFSLFRRIQVSNATSLVINCLSKIVKFF